LLRRHAVLHGAQVPAGDPLLDVDESRRGELDHAVGSETRAPASAVVGHPDAGAAAPAAPSMVTAPPPDAQPCPAALEALRPSPPAYAGSGWLRPRSMRKKKNAAPPTSRSSRRPEPPPKRPPRAP